MAVLKNIKLSTTYNEVHDITQDVKKVVEESDIQEGICIVHNMHSTAGLAVFHRGTRMDLLIWMKKSED